jgi:1-acyl-sn-glycerol-3-phosphate acyltransferase
MATHPSKSPARRRGKVRLTPVTPELPSESAVAGDPMASAAAVGVDAGTAAAAEVLGGSLEALTGLAGGILESLAPRFLRDLNHEIRDRIAKAPLELNSYGYDPWGLNADVARRALLVFALFYKYYFRVRAHGLENLPRGRMLVIANHAGQIAIDACMIGTATVLDADPPRPLRGMGEYWLPTIPFFNVLMARMGGVVGTPKNCIDILEHGEAVIAFPEGVRGMNKPFSERYQLQEFGNGFMRLALQTSTPIVPVAVVGSEEQAPSLGNFMPLARLLKMPAFPLVITPFPFPVRYHLYFGEPMEFRGNPNDEDEVIVRKVDQVKQRINEMIQRGLRERRGVFF